jgi:pyrimidine-specific ribonucleoside hydrolase
MQVLIAPLAALAIAAAALGAAQAEAPRPAWIDTDAACGAGVLTDVDDCIALVMAARSPRLALRGVGTVFGNAAQASTHATARRILRDRAEIPVYAGAARAGEPDTQAARALIAALRRERLTVLALGPLTNIAAALRRHPELSSGIEVLIVVAGRNGGAPMRAGANPVAHFHDVNVEHDPAAVAAVLASGVRLAFVPFDRTEPVAIGAADLARWRRDRVMAPALLDEAATWLAVWRHWHMTDAFWPFDAVATAYAIAPDAFACRGTDAKLTTGRGLTDRRRHALRLGGGGGVRATICAPAAAAVKALIERTLMERKGEEP